MEDLAMLSMSRWDVIVRLLVSMLVGAAVGMEREYSHRPAGLRTMTLVSLAAASVMIASQLLYCQYKPLGANMDPARMGAQVIAGVGFLGAGTIMKEGPTVKGLTTAASVWAVACLGLAAGAGYYDLALIAAVMILFVLTILEWIQRKIFPSSNRHDHADTDGAQ